MFSVSKCQVYDIILSSLQFHMKRLISAKMFERSFAFIDWKYIFKKKSILSFVWLFLIKFQSHETLRKPMKIILSETFSLCCSDQRITKTKLQTERIFQTCFLSFLHFFNERVLLVPPLTYNVLHLIYCSRIIHTHNNLNAVIVHRNRLILWPETLSSLIIFPDQSGESDIGETTDIFLVSYKCLKNMYL